MLTLGAYYADTPKSARALLTYSPKSWKQTEEKGGYICPSARCPDETCPDRALVWSLSDLKQEVEANEKGAYGRFARLRCRSCAREIGGDHLVLTREHMVRQPPDLLFTTTEMLNRRLSRSSEHALFGIGAAQPPRFMLLDEIHTYEGLPGAQVAYLLRRWRHARGRQQQNLSIVGLSATLTQAEVFFSGLTGVPPYYVGYITPRAEDMTEEGVEYNVLDCCDLKGIG